LGHFKQFEASDSSANCLIELSSKSRKWLNNDFGDTFKWLENAGLQVSFQPFARTSID